MRFLHAIKLQQALIDNNNSYANAKFYYNGEHSQQLGGIVTRDYPSFVHNQKEFISLVYWFKEGWDAIDINKTVTIINDFTNLKFIVGDTPMKDLISNGFDLEKHPIKKTLMILNSPMVGGKSSRNWYIHIFDVGDLPEVPDAVFPERQNVESLRQEIEKFEVFSNGTKKSRQTNSKISRYEPEQLRVTSKRKTVSSRTSEEDCKKAKHSVIDVNKIEQNFDIIDSIVFPKDCITMSSKLKYVSSAKSFRTEAPSLITRPDYFRLLLPEPNKRPKVNATNIVNEIEALELTPTEIMNIMESLENKVSFYTSNLFPMFF